MNFFKKGPEIKLSALKVPGPIQDVYYDLKDRHLLPLAVLLLLAIVIVPFALSKSSSGPTTGAAVESPAAATSSATASSSGGVLVAKSAPGLRDYKRRLGHLKSKNPFRQQYQVKEPSEGGSTSSEGGGETTTTPETETSTSGGSSGEHSGTGTSHIVYFSYAIDVRVTSGGAQNSASGGSETKTDKNVQVRHNLPELTKLPNRETPALIYMGSTKDGKKALMLVSSGVSAIFGDALCVLGSTSCELLALEVGAPETIVYGPSSRTYKIELLKIRLLETSKLNRAPLGKPHKHP